MSVRSLVLAVALLASVAVQAAPTLDRDLRDYFIVAQRAATLKNFGIVAPGCHVGVNCGQAKSNASCGVLFAKNASLGGVSQAVADQLCASDSFGAVFRNAPSGCDPTCDMIADPGPGPGCTSAWDPPIVGDLDHDGNPSCASGCVTDPDDLARACGVTLPLPACDPRKPVFVSENHDCSIGDVIPGNRRCDLAPGTYGNVIVRNGAWLEFGAGTTVVCQLKAGKATRIKSAGPAVVIAPDKGTIKLNNAADVGTGCGQLRFVTDRGVVHFGRNGDLTADVCAVRGLIKLGHANNLRGQYFGDKVGADFDNDGRCCASPVVIGSTTTTTTLGGGTTTTTSTTLGGGSTTTTTLGGGTTTTTTLGGGTTTTTLDGGGSTTTTTTPGGGSTTTTTLPAGGAFTRTIGFYKTHPAVTAQILAAAGPLTVCGKPIANVSVDSASSALEAMCVAPRGDQRVQLVRQLTGAALNLAAHGATWSGFAACNATCADPDASSSALTACIDAADAYNQSGDDIAAPWDPPGAASTSACDTALATKCTLLDTSSCATP